MMRVLVTGAAGFVGFHTCKHLLTMGFKVFGYDNLNNFYSTKLKQDRLDILLKHENFSFKKGDLNNSRELNNFISEFQPEVVYHLAAQAGVRNSFESPEQYIDSNINGTFNLWNL